MATFGYTTATASEGLTAGTDTVFAKYELSEAAEVSKITARLYVYSGYTGDMKALIYDDDSGTPGTLKGVSQATNVNSTSAANFDFTFASPVELTAGDYWLGLMVSSDAVYYYFCRDEGDSTRDWGRKNDPRFDYASPPSTAPALDDLFTDTNNWHCIYATYTVPSSVPEAPTINAYQSGSNIIVAWS